MDRSILTETTDEAFGPKLDQLKLIGGAAFVIGAILTAAGYLFNGGATQMMASYLFAFMFWLGVTIGSLALLMMHHATGGGWGFVIRRFLEAGSRLWWLMAIAFIPIALTAWLPLNALYSFDGAHTTGIVGWAYDWMQSEHDPKIHAKAMWLNPAFWTGRAVFYFALWGLFATLLSNWGKVFDQRADAATFRALNAWSGGGIVFYVLSVTVMTVDWVMSLSPKWYTTIIGLLFVAAQGLSTLALMLFLSGYLVGERPLGDDVPKPYWRDLGNLTLAATMLWAYTSFSQYLIQYSGNTVEEISWYVQRHKDGWMYIGAALIFLHFFLPFFVLLIGGWNGQDFGHWKKHPKPLMVIGGFIIVMRLVDLCFWVSPTFRDTVLMTQGFPIVLSDIGAPLMLGGIWVLAWQWQMRGRTLVPAHDPRIEEHLPDVLGEEASHSHA